jgi:hypothetical protein
LYDHGVLSRDAFCNLLWLFPRADKSALSCWVLRAFAGAALSTEPDQSEAETFLAFLDSEISALKQAMEKKAQKLAVLEELRADYLSRPRNLAAAGEVRLTSKQMLATRAIAAFLRDKDEPVPTTALLDYLTSQGIQFGGRHPRNTLSVLLSRSKMFIAHGRKGWMVVKE